jgi:hypothetical protein
VLVDGGQRREAELPADLLEAGRVAVALDELVQVIEDLALPFREWEHSRSPSPPIQRPSARDYMRR